MPIMTSVNSETDPRRQMLISMLMTGSTDSAIANTLNINVRSVRRWISDLMDELGVSTRLQLGAALVRSDGLRGDSARAGQSMIVPLDDCKPRARAIRKATPAVLSRTAGVAQGEELRAEPRGKVPHGLCWLSHAHYATQPPGTSGIPASFRKIWCSPCSVQTLSDFPADFTSCERRKSRAAARGEASRGVLSNDDAADFDVRAADRRENNAFLFHQLRRRRRQPGEHRPAQRAIEQRRSFLTSDDTAEFIPAPREQLEKRSYRRMCGGPDFNLRESQRLRTTSPSSGSILVTSPTGHGPETVPKIGAAALPAPPLRGDP